MLIVILSLTLLVSITCSIIDIDDLDLEGLDLKRLKNLKVERGLKVKVENVDIDERESYDNARPRRYYKASG